MALKHLLATCALLLSSLCFAAGKPLTFGMAQPYGEAHARKAKALIEPYLSKALGVPVTVVVSPTYDELSDALAAGKVDLAWITPLAFVQASQKNPDVTALSKAMRKGGGGLSYRAVFIAKKDSGLRGLTDLKGKKVAWVSKSSTSGYLFPREMLKAAGQSPDGYFASESFAGDHAAVCKAVREGQVDVGATFATDPDGKDARADGCADVGPIDDFKVIAASAAIPNEVIASRPDFAWDQKKINEWLGVFGRMSKSEDGKKVLKEAFRIDGWGLAVEGDFQPVIDLVKPKNAKAKVVPAEAPAEAPAAAPAPAARKK